MRNFSIEEYFQFEKHHLEKSEYYKGEILTMPGVSFRHNLITAQMLIALGNCLAEKPCLVCSNDMKFYMPSCQLNAYPDILAICEEPRYLEGAEHMVLLNPSLVGEVLSKSTEQYDRTVKLPCYLHTPSVQVVLLIHQDKVQIEVYHKNRPDQVEIYTKGTFQALGCRIALEKVYRHVKF